MYIERMLNCQNSWKKNPHPQKTDLHYMRQKSPSKIISFGSSKMVLVYNYQIHIIYSIYRRGLFISAIYKQPELY